MGNLTASIALRLAKAGYRVARATVEKLPTIPGKARGAAFTSGWNAASNNPDVIRLHWTFWPGPRILYATGAPSGVDVLDIDESTGGHLWLADHWHRLPRCFTYRTGGRGGWHVQLAHRLGQRSVPAGRLAPGVEIKSTGGFAIAWFAHGAPVLDRSPPAPWPDWLVAAAAPRPAPIYVRSSGYTDNPRFTQRRIERIIEKIESAPIGDRHKLLFWAGLIAGGMAKEGVLDDLEGALGDLAAAGIRAGKPHKEVWRTVRDGANAGLRNG